MSAGGRLAAVITGLGVISPYGVGADALMRGVSGGWCARACMCVSDQDIDAVLGDERHRFLNRESSLLLAAARLALADAGHRHDTIEHTGIVVSTRHAGLRDYAELFWAGFGKDAVGICPLRTKGNAMRPDVSPTRGPQTGLNAPAAHLSIRLGARGPNMTLTNGSAGGIDALAYAAGALAAGRATAMLVGGVDVLPGVGHPLSPDSRGYGQASPRPFDRCRRGPVPGEAGVVAVLEREADATRRGARAQARVRATTSAFAPDGNLQSACERSLAEALHVGALEPRRVGAVFAAASGSIAGDAAESWALHAVFGGRMPVCAVKGATADSMGAAALIQLAIALTSMRQSRIPATAGFTSRGADVAPIRILTEPEPLSRRPVVVHAWDAAHCAASVVLDSGDDLPLPDAHAR